MEILYLYLCGYEPGSPLKQQKSILKTKLQKAARNTLGNKFCLKLKIVFHILNIGIDDLMLQRILYQ